MRTVFKIAALGLGGGEGGRRRHLHALLGVRFLIRVIARLEKTFYSRGERERVREREKEKERE